MLALQRQTHRRRRRRQLEKARWVARDLRPNVPLSCAIKRNLLWHRLRRQAELTEGRRKGRDGLPALSFAPMILSF